MFEFTLTLSLDRTAVLFVFNVAILGLAAILASVRYLEIYTFRPKIPYYPTLLIFIVSMLLIPLVHDWLSFLFLWEIMTLASYFLIIYDWPEESAKKAGWKYFATMHLLDTSPLMLAIAIYYASHGTFNFGSITAHGNIIVALFLLGFAAKAGLFPFHFWLPDAHPAAPSPVSALLSGAMVELALYGTIRVLKSVGWSTSEWIIYTLGAMAVLSMLTAMLSYSIQDDVKRLFAWSTIDNMGWMYLLILAGLLGVTGVEKSIGYYVVSHGLAKAAAFISTGALLYVFGTRNLDEVRGIMNSDQLTAGLLMTSIFALEGVPPFNLFLSKLDVIRILLAVSPGLAYFAAIEWVVAFVLFLRVIHTYIISDGRPEPKRKLAGSIVIAVAMLLLLSMVSQFVCEYLWVRW
ncbi:proton-conducting transporter membrane subunit [Pyrococcus kukulkanii]|uniref:NADH dehydrogenase n=1 Tax=Pyrococcus kukulkanii TaxID=1609559 RepID=A0A127BBM9_9EURY|nr:proton-conducting transporter membrane subunit [Pyrococcus kukulkanii]AMM54741.1 NADH dehydrogenase [Pyrococcus kukulkanii]